MPDYKKMYYTLFNAVTDALEHLYQREWGSAAARLERAQQEGEEQFLQAGEGPRD